MRFGNKIALVTGGRSGIGRAIAQRLREEGARVFTAQRGKNDEFESVAVEFTDPSAAPGVVDEVIRRAGRLDVLVNSAGMMEEKLAEAMSLEDWSRNIAVNLTTPFMLIKAALPHLRAVKGTIVNIGSIEGMAANPRHAAYCATKAGLHGLTRAIAVDHGMDGIRRNAVAPGWIDTDLNMEFVEHMPDPERFRSGLSVIHPVGRTGKPQEVASLVAWLASNESSFVTGQVWTVDGGRMTKLSLPG
jgi:meso-butanediol dehydrogenase / (S,S)-butanediol dehydrogenase / diacetyl reductase